MGFWNEIWNEILSQSFERVQSLVAGLLI